MNLKINYGLSGKTLEVIIRELDSDAADDPLETIQMTATGNPGEYQGTLTVDPGDYYIALTEAGEAVQTGYIRLNEICYYLFQSYEELQTSTKPINANVVTVASAHVDVEDFGPFHINTFNPHKGKVLRLVRGDSYKVALGNALRFVDATFPDLTDADYCTFTVKNRSTNELAIDHVQSHSIEAEANTVVFELDGEDTSLDPKQKYKYDVEAHFGQDVITLSRNLCDITSDVEAET